MIFQIYQEEEEEVSVGNNPSPTDTKDPVSCVPLGDPV